MAHRLFGRLMTKIVIGAAAASSLFAFALPASADGIAQGSSVYHERYVSVTVKSGTGLSLGCANGEDNPLGYFTTFDVYQGWIDLTAQGQEIYTCLIDGQEGPAEVVNHYRYVECGIPE